MSAVADDLKPGWDNPDDYYVCGECGADQVQCEVWVDINTNEYMSDGGSDDRFCANCDRHIGGDSLPLSDYLQEQGITLEQWLLARAKQRTSQEAQGKTIMDLIEKNPDQRMNETNEAMSNAWNAIEGQIDAFTKAFSEYVKALDTATETTLAARSVIGDLPALDAQAKEEKDFCFALYRKRLDALAHARNTVIEAHDKALDAAKILSDYEDAALDVESWGTPASVITAIETKVKG